MIKQITNISNLQSIYSKVFKSNDPFSNAAQDSLPMRVVIFPTRGYHLNEEQFTALAKTNTILYGQNEFYVDGTWGFLISHENHALLGCTQEFWDEFKKQYQRWAEDYKEFIKYWRHWDNYRKQHMDKSAKNKWLSAFLDGLTVKPE